MLLEDEGSLNLGGFELKVGIEDEAIDERTDTVMMGGDCMDGHEAISKCSQSIKKTSVIKPKSAHENLYDFDECGSDA